MKLQLLLSVMLLNLLKTVSVLRHWLSCRKNYLKNSLQKRPYKKSNNRLLHIYSLSNHPPNVIKGIPNSIQERLSKNVSNEEILNTAKFEYEDTLKKSEF